jgi:nitroimidazol reductase NimA-like FMN-containing flavoprotein (pyridoxamine 5'-phosphate oxidase superfamily)
MVSLQELDLLNREQWIKLVRTVSVGRVIFTEHALPAVCPVEFRWWRGDVVIRIADPAVLVATSSNHIVAFEADELDADFHFGWSVTVVGRAQVITEVTEIIELSETFSRPAVEGRCDYFVRIKTEKVTGCEFERKPRVDNRSPGEFGDDQADETRQPGRHRRLEAEGLRQR